MNSIHQIFRFTVCLIGQPANIRDSCRYRENSNNKVAGLKRYVP